MQEFGHEGAQKRVQSGCSGAERPLRNRAREELLNGIVAL